MPAVAGEIRSFRYKAALNPVSQLQLSIDFRFLLRQSFDAVDIRADVIRHFFKGFRDLTDFILRTEVQRLRFFPAVQCKLPHLVRQKADGTDNPPLYKVQQDQQTAQKRQ